MVMADLPLSIFKYINKGVSALHFVASGTHGKFVNAAILAPVVTNADIALQNLALRLLRQETNKVVMNQIVVGSGNVTDGWKQDCVLGVTFCNCIRIFCGQCRIPKLEKVSDLLLCNGLSHGALGHDRGVMVINLPFSILKDVNEGITSLHFLPCCSHRELIDSSILAPVVSNSDMAFQNFTLGLQLQKVDKVILNARKVRSGRVTNSGQQHSTLGIPSRNRLRVQSCQGIVPQAEQSANLILRDCFAHGNFLWHNRGVVVLNLPNTILLNVVVAVTCLHNISRSTHCEFVDSSIRRPSIANVDLTIKNFSLRFLQEESIEVVLHGIEVSAWLVADSGKQHRLLDVPIRHNTRISSSQCLIPKLEKSTHFCLSNGATFHLCRGRRFLHHGLRLCCGGFFGKNQVPKAEV
mmetsp:Transcript_35592/g.75021  ORF Transcript_35592/g.75021 Transcript_35592/m.75021 type:complete len:409 (+) Transcript_35592:170-1396(+)